MAIVADWLASFASAVPMSAMNLARSCRDRSAPLEFLLLGPVASCLVRKEANSSSNAATVWPASFALAA
eukprot:CAMPEP_0172795120 /NCGR_PEP_ID=MMETSP1074-20121228/210321_1 /TAXON_ID=2916 /ORGANISM="Ceratium fusus, Strain PA161109" /LENGTH=68 /DNA_ID=CAMNT_0013632203 /DNA_START=1299 /DNA_END=1505 /DNA_ORIENTATION=+